MYIHIYIYRERERSSEKERKIKGERERECWSSSTCASPCMPSQPTAPFKRAPRVGPISIEAGPSRTRSSQPTYPLSGNCPVLKQLSSDYARINVRVLQFICNSPLT